MEPELRPDPAIQARLESARESHAKSRRTYLRFAIGFRVVVLLVLALITARILRTHWTITRTPGHAEDLARATRRPLFPVVGTALFFGVFLIRDLIRLRKLPRDPAPAGARGQHQGPPPGSPSSEAPM